MPTDAWERWPDGGISINCGGCSHNRFPTTPDPYGAGLGTNINPKGGPHAHQPR